MKDLGLQTQQGYVRMRNVFEVAAPDDNDTNMYENLVPALPHICDCLLWTCLCTLLAHIYTVVTTF